MQVKLKVHNYLFTRTINQLFKKQTYIRLDIWIYYKDFYTPIINILKINEHFLNIDDTGFIS